MILLVLLCLLPLVVCDDPCASVPPSLWCGNSALEAKCGFKENCDKFRAGTHDKPVLITLLMEGKCPGCQAFITDVLYPKVFKNFGDFVSIEIVPFGNAKIVNGSIVCQHGDEECQINKFESCLIDSVQTQDKYVPMIYCIENQLKAKVEFADAVQKCFQTYDVGFDVQRMIQSCLVSKVGARLQEKAGERTANVWPEQHLHVPWVLFNNVSLIAAQSLTDDIPALICQWYNGSKQIPFCRAQAKKMNKCKALN